MTRAKYGVEILKSEEKCEGCGRRLFVLRRGSLSCRACFHCMPMAHIAWKISTFLGLEPFDAVDLISEYYKPAV